MALAFKPYSVPVKLRGILSQLLPLINNRVLGICLQGKSIGELENRAEEFKDLDICWGGMNRFDVYQDYILDKMGKKLELTMDVGEVKFVEAFEKQLRVPRWKKYLQNPTSLLITSEEILANIKLYVNWDVEAEHSSQLIIIEQCRKISVPNSIMLYLMVLAKLKVEKIVLFGFDGFGNPKCFRDEPLWSAGGFENYINPNKSVSVYYKPETVLEQRRIGYQDERASDLHSNCPTFNDQFKGTYALFCADNKVSQSKIINCSSKALYTVFPKITYDQLKETVNDNKSKY